MIAIRLKYMHLKNILQGTLEKENSYLGNINEYFFIFQVFFIMFYIAFKF